MKPDVPYRLLQQRTDKRTDEEKEARCEEAKRNDTLSEEHCQGAALGVTHVAHRLLSD
jgi:hypothetical protein